MKPTTKEDCKRFGLRPVEPCTYPVSHADPCAPAARQARTGVGPGGLPCVQAAGTTRRAIRVPHGHIATSRRVFTSVDDEPAEDERREAAEEDRPPGYEPRIASWGNAVGMNFLGGKAQRGYTPEQARGSVRGRGRQIGAPREKPRLLADDNGTQPYNVLSAREGHLSRVREISARKLVRVEGQSFQGMGLL